MESVDQHVAIHDRWIPFGLQLGKECRHVDDTVLAASSSYGPLQNFVNKHAFACFRRDDSILHALDQESFSLTFRSLVDDLPGLTFLAIERSLTPLIDIHHGSQGIGCIGLPCDILIAEHSIDFKVACCPGIPCTTFRIISPSTRGTHEAPGVPKLMPWCWTLSHVERIALDSSPCSTSGNFRCTTTIVNFSSRRHTGISQLVLVIGVCLDDTRSHIINKLIPRSLLHVIGGIGSKLTKESWPSALWWNLYLLG